MLYSTSIIDEINRKFINGEIVKRDETPYYRNEIGVKKAFIKFIYTDAEMKELIKCKSNIQYFAEKYCQIKMSDGSVGSISLRKYQIDMLNDIEDNQLILQVKSRQIGSSLINSIKILHYLLFNIDKNVMILSNLRDTSIEIIDKIKNIYINLPFFLKVGIKNWNQKSIVFDNGCKIGAAARSKTPAIGFTIDFLFIDEFAHIPSNIIEPYYKLLLPLIKSRLNSKLIISSTPNGPNFFYKLYLESKEGNNNFKLIEVPYTVIPGRDSEWVKQTIRDIGGVDFFEQEYNLRFLKEDKVSHRLGKIESKEDKLSNRLDKIEEMLTQILNILNHMYRP